MRRLRFSQRSPKVLHARFNRNSGSIETPTFEWIKVLEPKAKGRDYRSVPLSPGRRNSSRDSFRRPRAAKSQEFRADKERLRDSFCRFYFLMRMLGFRTNPAYLLAGEDLLSSRETLDRRNAREECNILFLYSSTLIRGEATRCFVSKGWQCIFGVSQEMLGKRSIFNTVVSGRGYFQHGR